MPGIGARRLAAVVAAITTLAVLLAAFDPDAQARGYWQRCGDQGQLGVAGTTFARTISAAATRVGWARHWWDSGGDNTFDDWRCKVKVVGYELGKTDRKRTRGSKFQRVKFEHGS